mmetsp:Transcript_10839/g.16498  ORF Transcript_10839/g.16498 Transcript_10839/m.16498 type:complete len:235 (-) Transcript_10839:95-799(-)|eukprot:CAMPEP_0185022454 /NCGR_PEP_ID=MMETSP1103-20130426/5165_1 /TAXON_ID=36769 /ORGANISM="Paraphysomonas bandaiensis, Strain Caron Lab Isolate" /LENGTH=234 /DNA_ID=CAMNT_0027554525 /DNA_START=174 /DNA_END=878 /DNA_ORIENTATION=-
MGNVFGPQKTLKEIVRENQRMINKSIRELDREIKNLERNAKKLEGDIKKAGKENQYTAAKVMAKDLVRTRRNISRFIEMKSHLNGVSMKLLTVKSQDAMASAMRGVTKALTTMNKQVSVPGLQKIMMDFARENEKSELVQESIGDALDDAMEEDGAEEEEELVVSQVLDELGIQQMEGVPDAPEGKESAQTAEPTEQKAVAEGVGGGSAPGGGSSSGTAMSELEARLNNLKRNE